MPRYVRLACVVLVGATCYVVQLLLFEALLEVHVHAYWAGYMAFGLSAQVNFVLSKHITWRDRPSAPRQWVNYNMMTVILAAINASFVLAFTTMLWNWLAVGLAIAITMACSIVANHFFVFPGGSVQSTRIIWYEPKPGVAFFMPAHNEADNLHQVVGSAWSYFRQAGIPFTIIIVDDGSTDNTAQVLAELSNKPGIEVVTHEVNAGYGAALRSGIGAAFATGREFIAFCDSDGQFDPADVGLLLAAVEAEGSVDVAIGYREARADNSYRKFTGRVWHELSSLVLGFHAKDVDCGFKLFRRDAIARIDPTRLSGDHAVISPELLARLHRQGLNIVEVPMPHYPRLHGTQSGVKLSVMLGSIVGLFRLRSIIRKEVLTPEGGSRYVYEVAQTDAIA